MVFRKPYAFLIKNFKLIHIVLAILMGYFFYKIRNIASFLKQYISAGVFNRQDVVGQYLGLWAFLLPIVIIAIVILVMYLLKLKEKPIKYYLFTLIVFGIQIVLLILAYNGLNNIELGNIDLNILQIYRDLIGTLSYLVIFPIVVALIRGVGFNVKQFNFKKDLIDLDIREEDSEEFEVDVEVDTEDLKARLNRRLRFIKYVYLENKKVFFSLLIILILGIFIAVFAYVNSLEKIYKGTAHFKAYSLDVNLKNSYKTKYSYDGYLIKKNKFYVAVQLEVQNGSDVAVEIPYDNIAIRVSQQKKYFPIDEYSDEFSDFGKRFISTNKVKGQEKRVIVLVYELDDEYLKSNLRFEYQVNNNIRGATGNYEYVKVDLKPIDIDEKEIVAEETVELGKKLSFRDSLLDGTELQINSVEFNDRYSYKYKQKIGNLEREFTKVIIPSDAINSKKIVMKLTAELQENESLNPKVYNSMYNKFGIIEYEKDGKMVQQEMKIIDLTPDDSEDVYLEVIDEVSKSKKVNLIFRIRDREYKYILVNKE